MMMKNTSRDVYDVLNQEVKGNNNSDGGESTQDKDDKGSQAGSFGVDGLVDGSLD